MKVLTHDDIYPLRRRSAKKYAEWIRDGLNEFADHKKAAFAPIDSLLYFFEGSASDFLGAVYWALDTKARTQFCFATEKVLNSLLPENQEGFAECNRILPELLRFIARQNINCVESIKKLVISPDISSDDHLFLPLLEAAVGLSRHADSIELLQWFAKHPRVRNEHIPLLLIALTNCVPSQLSDHLKLVGHRLEPLIGNLPDERWKMLEDALHKRPGPAELNKAISEYSKQYPSSDLPDVLGRVQKILAENVNGRFRFTMETQSGSPSAPPPHREIVAGWRQANTIEARLAERDAKQWEKRNLLAGSHSTTPTTTPCTPHLTVI